MQIIRERLGGGVANANGVAWVGMNGYAGAVAGGGWAEVSTSGPCNGCSYQEDDTSTPDDATLHVVGSRMEIDPGTGESHFSMAFAALPGVRVCAHLWVVIP